MRWTAWVAIEPPVFRRWQSLPAAVIGLVAFASLLLGVFNLPRHQLEASLRVEHTLKVLAAASALEAGFQEAVSEARAYVNSGFPDTRARADAAAHKTLDDVAALRRLIADNAVQQAALDHVGELIDARIAMLRQQMDLKAVDDLDGLRQHLLARVGTPLTHNIMQDIESIRAEERRVLALHESAADRAMRESVASLIACGAIAAAGSFASLLLLLGRRREQAVLTALRRAEVLLRTVMQTASGFIYAKDLQGRMIVANTAVTDFLGKPWTELAGRTDREFLDDPAQGEAVMTNDRQVIAEGRTLVLEERVGTDRDKARIWRSTKTPLRDADGTIIGIIGVSVDITDLKSTEARLQAFNAELEGNVATRTAQLSASEARQRAYFDHSPIGMVVMRVRDDGDFVLEDLNPAARTTFGFRPDSVRGLTQWELWPELIARDKQEKMRDCAANRRTIEYTVAREIRGETRLLDVMLAPLLDDAAQSRFVLICVHDVTQLRDLERQVQEATALQAEAVELERVVFQNSPDELFVARVVDEPAGIAFIYEAFSRALQPTTGLRPEDLIGRRPEECLPPALAQSILDVYRRCVAEQTCIKFAATRQLAVGQRDVEGSVSPVRHPITGRVVRLAGVVRDVTERNRLEAALRHSHKMEAIGSLAAGVAHDFNNTLQAVIGSLDLAVDELPADTAAQKLTSTALDAALRGSHLTHHLLAYARKQILWPEAIDLASFLPEIERLLVRTLGPHITIALCVRDMPRARADAGELQTALLNLAINAAHAMPTGGTLHIAAQAECEPWVRLTLTDTGTGMDKATLAQAVEPFFTTKGAGGTGLGLSMVHGFAEQSGGTLRIDSAPGRGTVVELRLPAAAAAPAAPAVPRPADRRPMSGRILLVDDSTDVLVIVGAFLERAGYAVIRVERGEHALAVLAKDSHFDAMISDFAMPGLNGLDLIAQARLVKPGLPALIITGYAALGDADAAEDTAVLHKPFQRHELIAALDRVMSPEAVTAGRHLTGG
jgi:PAS domain S-box-containing protein